MDKFKYQVVKTWTKQDFHNQTDLLIRMRKPLLQKDYRFFKRIYKGQPQVSNYENYLAYKIIDLERYVEELRGLTRLNNRVIVRSNFPLLRKMFYRIKDFFKKKPLNIASFEELS